MAGIPSDLAERAHERLAPFLAMLVRVDGAPTLYHRVEDAVASILAELLAANADRDVIASVALDRDRAQFLAELLAERLQGIDATVAAAVEG